MFLDRTSKSFIAIFASVATILLMTNHAVNQAPLEDWWLAGLLLLVAVAFWVWLWQEREPEMATLMLSSNGSSEAAIHVREFIFEGKSTVYDAALPEALQEETVLDDDDDPQMRAAMEAAADSELSTLEMDPVAETAPDEIVYEEQAHAEVIVVDETAEPEVFAEVPVADVTEEAHTEIVPVEPAPTTIAEAVITPAQVEIDDTGVDDVPGGVASIGVHDLEVIEGIGPKYRDALIAAGITTFEQLAALSVERIEEIARDHGMRRSASMETWAEQASLAAEGKWTELRELQDALTAGRRGGDAAESL